ncbi:hypothetical protein [Crateriforma conspicua]|uniref:Uncharacterized protein n=1 Tax=Crateriforma conspicua TaxID=2527996 RepID=A0A5C6FUX9_9PLAN|nr:hypothetical protein [Crateriforma conspicua]TWU66882.1 hypothetical protein V7x_24530 [Crateriforma conspicua]
MRKHLSTLIIGLSIAGMASTYPRLLWATSAGMPGPSRVDTGYLDQNKRLNVCVREHISHLEKCRERACAETTARDLKDADLMRHLQCIDDSINLAKRIRNETAANIIRVEYPETNGMTLNEVREFLRQKLNERALHRHLLSGKHQAL